MTREEAMRIAQGLITDFKCESETMVEFCNVVIKALEQEPCEDCVRRQAVLEYIEGSEAELGHSSENELVCQDINELPPVTPKQEPKAGHWIETAEEYYKAINEKGGGVNENTPYFTDDIACSECLAKFSVIDNETERFICCPNCGAKMEGDKR